MEAASASDSAKADLNNLQLTTEADSYPEHEIPPRLLLEPQFRPTYFASDILNVQLNQKQIPTEGSQSIFSGAPSFDRKEAISNNETSGNDHAVLAHTAIFSLKRWNSLPAKTKLNNVSISSAADVEMHNEQHTLDRQTIIKTVKRSLSLPTQNFVIVKDGPTPFQKMGTHDDSSDGNFVSVQIKNDDDDIHEGDAICRICLAEFDGDEKCLKMECNCKGALRLTHEACAVKWFSLKGNRKCDVCCQEVLNLPVTLRRLLSSDPIPETQLVVNQILDNQQSSNQRLETQPSFNERFGNQPRLNWGSNSVSSWRWQDLFLLVIVSIISYFFFLEQLLIHEMQDYIVIVAAPVSFVLGSLGSIFAFVSAQKHYAWAYAAIQFSLVVVFLHLFYTMLGVRAGYAITFSTLVGFGTALIMNSLCFDIFTRRSQIRSQTNANTV